MKTAVALGTFDGLHAGHRAVLSKTQGFYSIAVTFRIPPKAIKAPCMLMTPEDRHQALIELGINEVSMFDFEDLCNLTPRQFLDFLRLKLGPTRIVCGFNYRFGKGAQGDRYYLSDYCAEHGIEFLCVESVCEDSSPVSSTSIRNLISCGDIKAANTMLYKPFGFTAEVIRGDHRGTKIGFPTINQPYPQLLVTPRFGVYSSTVTVDGKKYKGITNIGVRPTFKTEQVGSETYIKDFLFDVYEKSVRIELMDFIREEKKFSSLEELQNAIKKDVDSLFDE